MASRPTKIELHKLDDPLDAPLSYFKTDMGKMVFVSAQKSPLRQQWDAADKSMVVLLCTIIDAMYVPGGRIAAAMIKEITTLAQNLGMTITSRHLNEIELDSMTEKEKIEASQVEEYFALWNRSSDDNVVVFPGQADAS